MVYRQTSTELDANTVFREGIAIASILLVWLVFAGASLALADLVPDGSPVVTLARGGGWFFAVVGLGNVAMYAVLKSLFYYHDLQTS